MNKQVKKLANGIKYISCDYLSFGDYDNSCAIERANVRYLKSKVRKSSIDSHSMNDWEYLSKEYTIERGHIWSPIETKKKMVETYGGYGSIQLWIREDVWKEMELASLDNYPALDDELVSEIEMEMENEAWENDVKSDLIKTLSEEHTEEEMDNQECKCLNCNWEGKVNELKEDGIYGCPNCNNHYSIKYYDIDKQTLQEFADELDNETLWEIYRYCCDKTNTYGEVESGGNWFIQIDDLKECFANVIEKYRNGNELCDCHGNGRWDNEFKTIECALCHNTGFIVSVTE